MIFDIKHLQVTKKDTKGAIFRTVSIIHIPVGDPENFERLAQYLHELDSIVFVPVHRLNWFREHPIDRLVVQTLHTFFLNPDDAVLSRLVYDGEVTSSNVEVALSRLPSIADRHTM